MDECARLRKADIISIGVNCDKFIAHLLAAGFDLCLVQGREVGLQTVTRRGFVVDNDI